jgi:hypothetical protein
MRVNNDNSSCQTQIAMEDMDPEARAAAISIRDGQKMKQEGRKMRREAQRDQITHMKRTANKLREMADAKLAQGFTNMAASLASSATEMMGGKEAPETLKLGNAMLQGLKELDIAGYDIEKMKAEKAEIEAEGKAAEQTAGNANDDVTDGQRLQTSMTNLMEKVLDARHRARAAAIKA